MSRLREQPLNTDRLDYDNSSHVGMDSVGEETPLLSVRNRGKILIHFSFTKPSRVYIVFYTKILATVSIYASRECHARKRSNQSDVFNSVRW